MSPKINYPSGLFPDLVVAVSILCFGVLSWHSGQDISARAMLWPNTIFVTLITSGAGYLGFLLFKLLMANLRPVISTFKKENEDEKQSRLSLQEMVLIGVATLSTLGYVLLFPIIGFYTASFLLLVLVPLFLGYRNYRWIIGYSTITLFLLWVIFGLLLNRSLPTEFFL